MGKIIAMCSPIGSIGLTNTVTQLAFCLRTEGSVCIVDFNAPFGMVARYLNLDQPADSADSSQIATIVEHKEGIDLLPDPRIAGGTFAAEATITMCRQQYDYTLLDLPHSLLSPAAREAIGLADCVLVLVDYTRTERHRVLHFLQQLKGLTRTAPIRVIASGARLHSYRPIVKLILLIWGVVLFLCTTGALQFWLTLGIIATLPLLASEVLARVVTTRNIRCALQGAGWPVFHELPTDRRNVTCAINQGLVLERNSHIGRSLVVLSQKCARTLLPHCSDKRVIK